MGRQDAGHPPCRHQPHSLQASAAAAVAHPALLRGKAGSVLGAEGEEQAGGRDFHTGNWILRDRSLLVLDFDRQVVALQYGSGDLDDLCEFRGRDRWSG